MTTTPTEPRPGNPLVAVAILAAWLLLGGLMIARPDLPPLTFLFVMVGWTLAVMAHEFAHAAVAWLGGDHTVVAKGYLTFDPRRYGNLQTSLVIPLLALAMGGIGFPGGAVWLRTDLMRSSAWRAAASLAGPGATLLVLVVLAYVLNLWLKVSPPNLLFTALALLAYLQATALILNLLPLPGLDGFNAIRPFLPRSWAPAIGKAEGPAMLVLLALLLLVPGAGAWLFGLAARITDALGIPRQALGVGWDAFHFWQR